MTITEWILAVLGLIGTTSGLIVLKKSIELSKENKELKHFNAAKDERIKELEEQVEDWPRKPVEIITTQANLETANASMLMPVFFFTEAEVEARQLMREKLSQQLASLIARNMELTMSDLPEFDQLRINARFTYVAKDPQPLEYPGWLKARIEQKKETIGGIDLLKEGGAK